MNGGKNTKRIGLNKRVGKKKKLIGGTKKRGNGGIGGEGKGTRRTAVDS